MKRLALCLVLVVLIAVVSFAQTQRVEASGSSQPSSDPTRPKIAITFDDLPAHASLPAGETRIAVARKIITALQEAHLPPTYGFVNGMLLHQPEDSQVLKEWVEAGNKLGNHTWSHINLNQHTLQEFEADFERNEPLLAEYEKSGDWRWLRYPFLAEGETEQKRTEVRNYLQREGYKIAGVTMGFADYLYNDAYARCSARGDKQSMALLEDAFLTSAYNNILYSRRLSHDLFGRDVPYVLLMHFGALDARLLPRLLKLYQSQGFEFVTLDQAENDEFYKGLINPGLPASPDSLEGVAAQRGVPLPARTISLPDFDKLCR